MSEEAIYHREWVVNKWKQYDCRIYDQSRAHPNLPGRGVGQGARYSNSDFDVAFDVDGKYNRMIIGGVAFRLEMGKWGRPVTFNLLCQLFMEDAVQEGYNIAENELRRTLQRYLLEKTQQFFVRNIVKGGQYGNPEKTCPSKDSALARRKQGRDSPTVDPMPQRAPKKWKTPEV